MSLARTSPMRRPSGEGPLGGFTIMELMVVMLIMGLVLGAGIGAFASFDPGSSAARGLVANALRQARNEAVAHRAPARVAFDPETGSMRSEGYRVVGTWRFEEESLPGAGGVDGFPDGFPGTILSDDGFIGRALDLDLGGRAAKVSFDLTEDPAFAVRRGFRLAMALRPLEVQEARIADLGGVVLLDARSDGSVEVGVVTRRLDELGRSRAGERLTLRTRPGVLEPERWVQLEVRYDRQRLVALANGVPVAERGETRELWRLSSAFVLGGGRSRFSGRIDDVVLSTATTSAETKLPPTVQFAAPGPFEVRFDEGGRLDPVIHAGPVEIALEFDDGGSALLEVLRMGTVE